MLCLPRVIRVYCYRALQNFLKTPNYSIIVWSIWIVVKVLMLHLTSLVVGPISFLQARFSKMKGIKVMISLGNLQINFGLVFFQSCPVGHSAVAAIINLYLSYVGRYLSASHLNVKNGTCAVARFCSNEQVNTEARLSLHFSYRCPS